MLGRPALRTFLHRHHKSSIPSTEMPGTNLNLQDFINHTVTALYELNDFLAQPRVSGVHYSENYTKHFHPNYSSLDLDGITNPHYFQIHEDNYFPALPHCIPSEALTAFFRGPTFADCGSGLQACMYRSLETMVGTEIFNQAFNKQTTPFVITSIIHAPIRNQLSNDVDQARKKGNPIFHLFDFRFIDKDSDADINLGDIIYIKGVKKYAKRHPEGAGGGWNVICVGKNNQNENLYLGFSPFLFVTPKTYAEIKHRMMDDYTATPSVYSKNASGWLNYLFPNKADPNESCIGIRGCISLNLAKTYHFFFEHLPNWHSMTMMQLAANNHTPEPSISTHGLFAGDNVDNQLRVTLRKFAFSITGKSSVPRGLFLGKVFTPNVKCLFSIMNYLQLHNKKIAVLDSNLIDHLKNHNIITQVGWIDKNAVIPVALLNPNADVFVFDNLDVNQYEVRFLIKKVLGYVLENHAAILVYSQQEIPSLFNLMPVHLDYTDERVNNFLLLQTRKDVCNYTKTDADTSLPTAVK